MGTYNSAVITTAGQALLARTLADNLQFYFTSAKTTEYVVPSGTSAASLTELPNIKQSEEITSATVSGSNQVTTSVRFDNTEITLDYSINTIGVYAKAGTDAEETLLAVITAQTADVMPSYSAANPVAYVYSINLAISNASNINIIVSPTGVPSYAEFNNAVRFDIAQEKTEAEKAQARANIGVEDSEVYAENVIAEYEVVTEPSKTYAEITEDITATSTTSGYIWSATTSQAVAVTNGVYSRFDGLSNYKKVYVSGRPQEPTAGNICYLISFYNNLGENVGNRIDGAWGQVNCLIDVPDNASYAIVNGTTETNRQIPPTVKGLIDGETLGTMISLTGTVTEGAKKTDGTVAQGANYYFTQYNTIPDSTYIYVSGTSWGATYPLVLFYNASNALIKTEYAYGSTRYFDVEISIPSEATSYIVNMTHQVLVNTQGVQYPIPETGRITTKTQAEYNNELKPLIDKKYLFVGDSYAEGYSHDGSNLGWCRYAVEYLGLDTDKYKSVYTGGYGFANGGFSNLLDTVTETGFTDVVVCGGYNDNTSTEQNIINGITAFKNKALGKWSNVKIHVGFIGYNKAGNGEGAVVNWEEKRANLVDIVLPAYQNCVTVGCEYLNNVEYALGESGLTPSDGYHPSAVGNQSIAKAIANALLTGSASLPYNSDLRAS